MPHLVVHAILKALGDKLVQVPISSSVFGAGLSLHAVSQHTYPIKCEVTKHLFHGLECVIEDRVLREATVEHQESLHLVFGGIADFQGL